MTALRAVTDRHGLALVEDAAQAHLASIGPTRCGAFGAAAGFSFYPGKNLGALGDAGAVTTDDDALAASLRKLRNYGSAERYRHDTVGMNSRLDEVQAAVLRAKLPHLERWTARRAALAARYTAGLADAVEPLQVIAGRRHAWHLYVVRVGDPDGLARELAAGGVGTLRHYPVPPHRSGAYAVTHGHLRFPGADALASSCLSLPFGPAVDAATADRVVGAVRAARHASPMGASAR